MNIQLVSLCQTDASRKAGCPALTPELLAATGARYSRNNEGLRSILARIDPGNLDKSVDSIFRMIDYGHQSIADMVPVAIFMDGLSLWLAYHVWSLVSLAGGQESSTRYIRVSPESLVDADTLGVPDALRAEWKAQMEGGFRRYEALLAAWGALAESDPALVRIPAGLLADGSEKAAKQVARMRRNYAFDRARYLLPVAASTNMMLQMSARAWAALCQRLCSDSLAEARLLGEELRKALALDAPHLLRHSGATDEFRGGLADEFARRVALAKSGLPPALADDASSPAADDAHLDVMPPAGVGGADFAAALSRHSNRYSWTGSPLQRTMVRFGWDAVALAEIRDLNRHRTGTKYSTLVPKGFYGAEDQLPSAGEEARAAVADAAAFGRSASRRAHALLAEGDPTYVYWTLLGTQYDFEHTTTADKFIYEAELRTGAGSHFRYARHLHAALSLWFERFPETRGLVLEGTAEPE
jgi:thymidylate synthase ThyX